MHVGVILAGGGGTRLWPASRRERPKQFLPLGARPGESLLEATFRRVAPRCDETVVVTAAGQAAHVRALLPGTKILAEPVGRNTAAAIGLAAISYPDDAILALLPADQHIADEARFGDTVRAAFELAQERDAIVTVGIKPTRPETGFGWLEPGPDHAVVRFVEKPQRLDAERYLAAGYLWNGGIFFFRAGKLLDELARHLPDLHAGLREIQAAPEKLPEIYPRLPSISIDYGVMERTTGILTVVGDFGWNDVGAWPALADYRPKDAQGNVTDGETVLHDAADNIVVTDAGVVALVGVRDLVVVRSGDAVLVLPKDRAQDVKEIVKALEARKRDAYL